MHDKGRGEYVLNGRKYWPCNAGGWDLKGANVNVCIVRTDAQKGGKSGLSGMLVPRGAKPRAFVSAANFAGVLQTEIFSFSSIILKRGAGRSDFGA